MIFSGILNFFFSSFLLSSFFLSFPLILNRCTHTRRVPRPGLLARRVDAVIRAFEAVDNVSKGTIDYDPIITAAVLNEHRKQIKIIQDGQVSDPNDRPMYIDVGQGSVIKNFVCVRGTNGLEGGHEHMKKLVDVVYMNPNTINVL